MSDVIADILVVALIVYSLDHPSPSHHGPQPTCKEVLSMVSGTCKNGTAMGEQDNAVKHWHYLRSEDMKTKDELWSWIEETTI